MSVFLAEIGRNLAVRWFSHLVPSGLLFLAVAGAGLLLGHAHWYDLGVITQQLNELAARPVTRSPGAVILTAAGILAASAGLALAVRSLGNALEAWWAGVWPVPLSFVARRLTARRQRRWEDADDAYQTAVSEAAADTRIRRSPLSGETLTDIERLNAVRNRISLVEPRRPTWIADRIRAADQRVFNAYRLDLNSAWTRLWLIIPDSARAELRTARQAYDDSVRLSAWSVPYLALAGGWWPAALIAVALAGIGCRRGRAAMDTFAELVESAVDLHGRELAVALGLSCPGTLDQETGRSITSILRKDS